jgi:FAD/FMN-containing dehydrogenase
VQGRLHWGQYLTPPFTALQYNQHDPEYFESISSFKKIAEQFDPDRIMWNDFMNYTIWSAV